MARRTAIAASSVSAVVFSVLLLSSLAVFTSAQTRARMYSLADAEDSAGDGFAVLESAGAANILLALQGEIGGNVLGCSSAGSGLAQYALGLADQQRGGSVTVITRAELVQNGPLYDNLTGLSPFEGTVTGDVGLALQVQGQARSVGGVTFERNETHFVHLGFRLTSGVADCLATVDYVERLLSSSPISNCTSAEVAPLVARAGGIGSAAAARDGFSLQTSYSIAGTLPCAVDFTVSLEQFAIQGVGGQFTARLAQRSEAYPPPESS